MKKTVLLLIALSGLVSSGFGAIQWETTQVELTAPVLAESVEAAFRFTNTGKTAVVFKEIKPSCGCTTAVLEKLTYAPGESGVVKAKLDIGYRQGLQTKTITVNIKGETAPTLLTMQTRIPSILNINPVFVFWTKGQIPTPKTITLAVGIDAPVHILSVSSSHESINASLETLEEGKRYKLTVVPLSTDAGNQANITIVTDYPKDNPKAFNVLAQVK